MTVLQGEDFSRYQRFVFFHAPLMLPFISYSVWFSCCRQCFSNPGAAQCGKLSLRLCLVIEIREDNAAVSVARFKVNLLTPKGTSPSFWVLSLKRPYIYRMYTRHSAKKAMGDTNDRGMWVLLCFLVRGGWGQMCVCVKRRGKERWGERLPYKCINNMNNSTPAA